MHPPLLIHVISFFLPSCHSSFICFFFHSFHYFFIPILLIFSFILTSTLIKHEKNISSLRIYQRIFLLKKFTCKSVLPVFSRPYIILEWPVLMNDLSFIWHLTILSHVKQSNAHVNSPVHFRWNCKTLHIKIRSDHRWSFAYNLTLVLIFSCFYSLFQIWHWKVQRVTSIKM